MTEALFHIKCALRASTFVYQKIGAPPLIVLGSAVWKINCVINKTRF